MRKILSIILLILSVGCAKLERIPLASPVPFTTIQSAVNAATPTRTPTSFVIVTDTVPPSPTRTPTATASPTFTPVCYPVYVGGKLIGNFCP